MSNVIYDYFKMNFGTVKESDQSQLEMKYNNLTTGKLKKILKHLKDNNAPLREIKYISHLLRSKLQTTPSITSANLNQDALISKNVWSYVKGALKKRSSLLLSFTLNHCVNIFHKTLWSAFPNKQFIIPSWVPQFQAPTYSFDHQPLSYQKITAIIGCMKSSASPNPLDQVSIICFKRC